jgi:P-type Mg2+ transporter
LTGWQKIDEVPFDFERRRVSVLVEHDAKRRLIVKGAPEDLLRLSGRYEGADGVEQPLDPETRRIFEATLDALGAQGFRALGIASRVVDGSHDTAAITDESDLVFSGFAVILGTLTGQLPKIEYPIVPVRTNATPEPSLVR